MTTLEELRVNRINRRRERLAEIRRLWMENKASGLETVRSLVAEGIPAEDAWFFVSKW